MPAFDLRLLRAIVSLVPYLPKKVLPPLQVSDLAIAGVPCRLYMPENGTASPPLVFMHGGGFISCSLDTHDSLCRYLAAATGLRVISVGYRLAPEARPPAQLEDALNVCHAVLADARSVGGNAAALYLGGDSAGGYLACRCTLALNSEKPGTVLGQVLIYPLLQMERPVWDEHAALNHNFVGRHVISRIRACLGEAAYESIFDMAQDVFAPTVMIGGKSLDPLYADNRAWVKVLEEAGVSITYRAYDRIAHGAFNFADLVPGVGSVFDELGAMVRENLLNRD